MAIIQQQINPQLISDRQSEIDRSSKLAALLQANAQNTAVNREVSGRVVPVSPWEALFKGLQTGTAAYQDAKATRMEHQNELDKNSALVSALKGGGNIDQLAQSGAFDNDSLAKLIQDKQKAKEAKDLVDYKLQQPTNGMQEALFAANGDPDKAREFLQNKINNPLGMMNYNLQAGNIQNDNTFKDKQLKIQTDNINTDNQFKQDQLALQKQQLEIQRAEAERKAKEAAQPKPLSEFQQYKLDDLKTQKEMARQNSQLSSQTVLDQLDTLYNHPGRKAATGASSFLSAVPGTDAKGFSSQLDTFKAQSFIPMVSALKGMGALSDAEGKKLTESVGALNQSMPEDEFAKSLKDISQTLYKKAKISGLEVNLPDFAKPPTVQNAKGNFEYINGEWHQVTP